MDWICLNIYTTHMGIEPLCAMLLDLGITGVVINDPYDINEFVANKTAEWDYIDEELADTADKEAFVTVYLSNDADGIELLNEVNNGLLRLKAIDTAGEYGRLETDNSSLSEEDWANNWKQYFKPIEIGEKILIKPTWETIPENNTRVIVELDPDSSFGTGRHFTTQICLELLEKYLERGDRMADLGCGSGIISIAGMRLGAASAVCTDIAENAVRIAKENAHQNGIHDESYTVFCGDVASDPEAFKKLGKGFDLVAANIVADVLLSMTEVFAKITKKGGTLVISGIIDDRLDEVMTAVKSAGFTVVELLHRDIWNGCALRRNDD